MNVFMDIEALPEFSRPVVTVGSFDGVHRGHRHLLDIVRNRALRAERESVVVTFATHPRTLLEPMDEVRLLTTLEERILLIGESGIDNLVVIPFDRRFSELEPEEFVREFLVQKIGVQELVVGYNHRLGRDRKGDVDVLRRLGRKYGFRVHEASKFESSEEGLNGEKISSTAIRQALARGDKELAERMLGRTIE